MLGTFRRRVAAVAAALVAAVGAATGGYYLTTGGASTLTGPVVLTDQTFTCNQPIALDSLTVTITAASASPMAVRTGPNCTGTTGPVTIKDEKGDGIDIQGGHDLTFGVVPLTGTECDTHVAGSCPGGSVVCTGYTLGAHQDGIQALSGTHVRFEGMDVSCGSANNAAIFINDVPFDTRPAPNDVVFEHGSLGCTTSKSADVSDNQTASGVRYSAILPSRLFTYEKGPAETAIDVGNTRPEVC